MAKFVKNSALEEFELMLSKLSQNTTDIAKTSVYEGAKIATDAIREEIQNLPTYPDEPVYTIHKKSGKTLKGVNAEQKKGLLTGLGISQMGNEQGTIDVKIGFVGYNSVKTKEFPKGQPNPLIARSIIRGTSIRKKNDFISKAMKKTSDLINEKMAEVIEQKIDEITE